MSNIKKIILKITPTIIIRTVKNLIKGKYSYYFWLFPINKNKIVICNYYGNGFGDNGKYIVNELINQKNNYDIVWLIRKELINNSEFPEKVRVVKNNSFKALFELATAKIWIDNCRKSFYPPKRKSQYYIQTWHGGIALKQVEKDVEKNLSKLYVEMAKKDSKMADLFISNSKFCTKMYRSAFWYKGEILEVGSPRCDILFKNPQAIHDKVRNYFNISPDSRILIYAPTFRVDSNTEVYNIDYERLLQVLEKKFGGKWVILVRLHPNISFKDSFLKNISSVINATKYSDIYELLVASDILITDYSSTMFEFSFTGKPVFLYAADIEEYRKDRNFYFDIYSLPYPIAENNDELCNNIKMFDNITYLEKLKQLFSDIGLIENGNASQQVANIIKKVILDSK